MCFSFFFSFLKNFKINNEEKYTEESKVSPNSSIQRQSGLPVWICVCISIILYKWDQLYIYPDFLSLFTWKERIQFSDSIEFFMLQRSALCGRATVLLLFLTSFPVNGLVGVYQFFAIFE